MKTINVTRSSMPDFQGCCEKINVFGKSRRLTLPLFADLTIEDVDRICDIILG